MATVKKYKINDDVKSSSVLYLCGKKLWNIIYKYVESDGQTNGWE